MRAALLAWREGCPWRGNGKRATKGLAAKSKPPSRGAGSIHHWIANPLSTQPCGQTVRTGKVEPFSTGAATRDTEPRLSVLP